MMKSKSIKKIYIGFLMLVAIMIVTGIFLYNWTDYEKLIEGYARDMAIDCLGMMICEVLLIGIFAGENEDKRNHAMFRIIFSLSLLFFIDLLSSCIEGDARFVTTILIVNTIGFMFEDILAYTY